MQNPEKCASAMRETLNEILDKEFPAAALLQPSQRSELLDWLCRDPVIQDRLLNYLQLTGSAGGAT